jgi:hypothetical protein
VLVAGVSGVATAQSLSIADSESIFVDGNSFEVVPGKGKGNASALIDELDARDLGPGTIIFRSGNRLYLVDAPTVQAQGSAVTVATTAATAGIMVVAGSPS